MSETLAALPEAAPVSRQPFPLPDDLPLRAAVRVPLRKITLRQVAKLAGGSLVEGDWPVTGDVPLSIGGALVAWGEFCSANDQIAIRLTRLAS